ncbi:hypothetical protein KP509_04G035200 [Ceratopteris richardii]|uniref:Uncharacterized protein n=1 Tax=Ceratopteris richardii TaxID=49495 RepID=A0A8T2UW19_CERRI|nr:hypothetical protein KP509_04G035200 [Ceratopteris richardii]
MDALRKPKLVRTLLHATARILPSAPSLPAVDKKLRTLKSSISPSPAAQDGVALLINKSEVKGSVRRTGSQTRKQKKESKEGGATEAKQEKKSQRKRAPKGCVPVIVNNQHRIMIHVSRLQNPLVLSLLEATAQIKGRSATYEGALELFCDADSFEGLLRLAACVS